MPKPSVTAPRPASPPTVLAALAPPPSSEKAELQASSYRLVNATGLPGPLRFQVNGIDISASGYPSGEYTGSMLPPAGSLLRVAATHPACGSAVQQGSIPLSSGAQLAVVARLAFDTPAGKPPCILFEALPSQPPTTQRRGFVVSYSAAPAVEVSFGLLNVKLTPGQSQTVMLRLQRSRQGTALPVQVAERTISTLDLERAGNHAIIFYDDIATGQLTCITFMHDIVE